MDENSKKEKPAGEHPWLPAQELARRRLITAQLFLVIVVILMGFGWAFPRDCFLNQQKLGDVTAQQQSSQLGSVSASPVSAPSQTTDALIWLHAIDRATLIIVFAITIWAVAVLIRTD